MRIQCPVDSAAIMSMFQSCSIDDWLLFVWIFGNPALFPVYPGYETPKVP